MARDKLEEARREGMAYALKIAKTKGIEGLEKECKFSFTWGSKFYF